MCPRREGGDPPPLLWPEDWEEGITPVDLLRISTQSCPGSTDSPRPYRCPDGPGDAQGGRSPQFYVVCQSSAKSTGAAAQSGERAQGGREAHGLFARANGCSAERVFSCNALAETSYIL